MKIEGLAVLITGGASGLGKAFALHLLGLGARVWVVDRDEKALAQTLASHAKLQGRRCDVGLEEDAVDAVAAIEAESGGISVLVNNAAVLKDQSLVAKLGKKIKKHSLADWQETLASNLTGAFLMGRECAEKMIVGKRKGLIVNISSISRQGNAGQSAYSATKGGIDGLTFTWAKELAYYGIRVVAIAPGFVETAMTKEIPPMFLERIKERTPLQRFGTLEEFALTIQYVIENDYLHGTVLELDGGLRF